MSSRLENSTFELHWPQLMWRVGPCSRYPEDTRFVTRQLLNFILGLIMSCVHEWEEEVCVYSLSNMRPYEYVTIRVYAIILRS